VKVGELRRDRPATAPSTGHSQTVAELFEASLRRFRKRDRESELAMGDLCAERSPKAPTPSFAVEAPLPEDCAAFRFRRMGVGAARCLEVVHARSGTRFVLSHDGSAWLLAVESDNAPDAGELSTALAMLNETFAALGLGPIDVIVG
jgi:hypothetical protein